MPRTVRNKRILTFPHNQMIQSLLISPIKIRDFGPFLNRPCHMNFRCRGSKISGIFSRLAFLAQFKKAYRFSGTRHSTCCNGTAISGAHDNDIVFRTHHGDRTGNALVFFWGGMSDVIAFAGEGVLTERDASLENGGIVRFGGLYICWAISS